MTMHLIKLIVGLITIDEFAAYQKHALVDFDGQKVNTVITLHRPKQADDILKNGGSMYRVMQNTILFRQRIVGFDEIIHPEKGKMCLIACAPEIIRTVPMPKRPFQGWRYLKPEDAPPDLINANNQIDEHESVALAAELRAAGLI